MKWTNGSPAARFLWTLLIVALGGVIFAWAGTRYLWPDLVPRSPRHGALDRFGEVRDFQLTDQLGRPVSLADFKGQPWVADFIFTRCGGPCPMMTRQMAWLADTLGAGVPVRFASFSVDPDYDTPEVMRAYAEQFGADHERWRFLTGPRLTISDISINSFHLAMGDPSPAAPVPADSLANVNLIDIAHSVRFVLVDGSGQIRGYYDGTDIEALRRLARDVRGLVKGGA